MGAENALSMSLDDVIKQQKSGPGAKRGKAKTKPTRGGKSVAGKKISKGGGEATRFGGKVKVKALELKKLKSVLEKGGSAGAGKWKHDKFQGAGGSAMAASTKLFVSNLHLDVTNKDLRELFGECGTLKSWNIHFDRNGKSQGTADVVFQRAPDAKKAIKEYNGRTLDGKPLQILMIEDNGQKVLSSGRVLGNSPGGPPPYGGGRPGGATVTLTRSFRGGRRGRGGRGGSKMRMDMT